MHQKQILGLFSSTAFSSDNRRQQEADLTSRVCRPGEGEEEQPSSADWIASESSCSHKIATPITQNGFYAPQTHHFTPLT